MKKSKMKWLGTLGLAILLASSLNVNAQGFRGEQKPQSDHPMEMNRGKKSDQMRPEQRGPKIPNLTDAQENQLKEFRLEEMKKAQPIENLVAEKEARLNTLTSAEKYDEKAVNKVIEEIGDLKADLAKLKVAGQQKVKSILTEEQLVFFNQHQQKGPKQNGPRRK
ncbi:Spy/CpxP family protein refolding chaperone [Roseivirga ehrenbergii]|uniref:Periplasmic heavy metal sensor n=1 Tax=Roseivirga ehrenbergii (strain DSM 102268 / JCM 13514 / KCTC 12282 / NCIMB 14502 / KMM 6017) TaxID=279360 RepID=A0A150XN51_ROSEK|nr:Spy/CpxP family protein refolding chaperone [Roseivirga ehrenbergii]KYG80187.1 hypothetical protein MB14_16740 [Roseivirga ehrenbergii]TCK99218.1 Spy/CpxP family protein refolding chaperone [Roseivirga ehrenbergii]